jgi:glucosamine--fructose-6-phosphate aminotransferase (isomerizing)
MCGIIGIVLKNNVEFDSAKLDALINDMFIFSEIRGKEATGFSFKDYKTKEIIFNREPEPASTFIDSELFKSIKNRAKQNLELKLPISIIGHTRIATNGSAISDNQPIQKGGLLGVHNGIICNVEKLWKTDGQNFQREFEIDTEFLVSYFDSEIRKENFEFQKTTDNFFSKIEGTASFILQDSNSSNLYVTTNCGSLYYYENSSITLIASEYLILLDVLTRNKIGPIESQIHKLESCKGLIVSETIFNGEIAESAFKFKELKPKKSFVFKKNKIALEELGAITQVNFEKIKGIKRCTKCILPETHPYIIFDNDGICNYCKQYELRKSPKLVNGLELLEKELEPIRAIKGTNCIFMLSGGRDSCYGLHVAVKELGLRPVAFSYDWGMLTDLGRRNQVRMCQKLNVEHIIVSADIALKRRNIRLNVEAFLKNPHLGLIGLFMAGDKAVNYHTEILANRLNLKVINGGCPYEYTYFKEGFANIKPSFLRNNLWEKSAIIRFYIDQALTNHYLINKSIPDNLKAYYTYYVKVLDNIKLFRYMPWVEKDINDILISEYNWEVANDTTTTWRIGDGTASFYNYIYNTVAGFTENDCFRSNQILDGIMTREEALSLVYDENKPRIETLLWYFDIIGVDAEKTINTINKIKKLY